MSELGDHLRAAGDAADVLAARVSELEGHEHPDMVHVHPSYALATHTHEGTPPPPIWTPPNPEDDGFTLAHAANIATAEDEEMLNVHIFEGHESGVTLEQFEGVQVLKFSLQPEYDHLKVAGGTRASITFGGVQASKTGYDDVAVYLREIRYDPIDGTILWPDLISTQSHSIPSGARQNSPMFSFRHWDGESGRFTREREDGSHDHIGPYIHPPIGLWLFEILSFELRDDGQGWARYQLFRMDTGEEITTDKHLYRGPTQIGRDGFDYDPQDVAAYWNNGLYGTGRRREAGVGATYRARRAEVWTKKAA